MQINHHYHAGHFRSLGDMLDPKQNVDYAARFLLTLKHRHDTWSMAVARYHAGPDNDPAQKRMSAASSPTWSPPASANGPRNARTFCNQ